MLAGGSVRLFVCLQYVCVCWVNGESRAVEREVEHESLFSRVNPPVAHQILLIWEAFPVNRLVNCCVSPVFLLFKLKELQFVHFVWAEVLSEVSYAVTFLPRLALSLSFTRIKEALADRFAFLWQNESSGSALTENDTLSQGNLCTFQNVNRTLEKKRALYVCITASVRVRSPLFYKLAPLTFKQRNNNQWAVINDKSHLCTQFSPPAGLDTTL